MIVNKNGNAFEFLIIGGGMAGISSAHHLNKKYKTLMLKKDEIIM